MLQGRRDFEDLGKDGSSSLVKKKKEEEQENNTYEVYSFRSSQITRAQVLRFTFTDVNILFFTSFKKH